MIDKSKIQFFFQSEEIKIDQYQSCRVVYYSGYGFKGRLQIQLYAGTYK